MCLELFFSSKLVVALVRCNMFIKWAKIRNVSFERRLQLISASMFFVLIYLGEMFCCLFFLFILVIFFLQNLKVTNQL